MRLVTRTDVLNIFGATSLLIAIVGIPFGIDSSNFVTYAVIFITGAIITSAVENKK